MPEEQVFEDATDEDIFSAVRKARTDQENMEINGAMIIRTIWLMIQSSHARKLPRLFQLYANISRTLMGHSRRSWKWVW
jgi:hypothetical protein